MQFIKGIIIAVIVLLLDQYSKFYIFDLLDQQQYPMIEITSFFNLVKVYNYGVSFGMFDQMASGRVILSAIAIIITIILLIWLYRAKYTYLAIGLGLVIGGAIGNIIDRIRIGAVADFLDFHIMGYHWPAFNVADSAVFVGVLILLIDSFLQKEEGK